MTQKTHEDPLVPIRVDRLRAAQELDGRGWPEVARAIGTTHQRLYHLSTGEGPSQRRCRLSLRDGFAQFFEVDPDWLSGQTDSLRYVLSADASIVNLSESRPEAQTRITPLQGSGHNLPGLQLALDRLLIRASRSLDRDLNQRQLEAIDTGAWSLAQIRGCGLYLIASIVEASLDLVTPLPTKDQADAMRISAVRHAEQIFRPWFDGTGPTPDWDIIQQRIERWAKDDRAGMAFFLFLDLGAYKVLTAIYEHLRRQEHA